MKTLKKIFKIILISILILIVGVYLWTIPRFKENGEVYPSPDGKYVLKVYAQTNFIRIGIGDGGFKHAYVVLEDRNGNVLCKPTIFNSCKEAIISEVWGNWEEEEDKVYFTKFSYIDLNTMKMHCLE
ncbi:hypothetical protein [uncultured Algibacter sp.]|uniref:hypothetical protein n=1 Tax=uncultured Algibacter sp. TaxID=298659 RepID=UPI003216AC17